MITEHEAYNALSDAEKQNEAFAKMSAKRKATLANYRCPLHVLKQHGVKAPHRTFNPEGERPKTASLRVDGTVVNYCQDVREDFSDAFGSFGAVDETEDETIWTVFDIDMEAEAVTMKVVGEWGQRREVPFAEFARNYDPIWCDGSPRFGY
jgi:hypothetical protein